MTTNVPGPYTQPSNVDDGSLMSLSTVLRSSLFGFAKAGDARRKPRLGKEYECWGVLTLVAALVILTARPSMPEVQAKESWSAIWPAGGALAR